jgi:hypothetical protein
VLMLMGFARLSPYLRIYALSLILMVGRLTLCTTKLCNARI